ncbi:NAD-dependent epimerase/dehydratase family protein [Sphaerisporangium sp. TRM90804]|uniref:NAD-dependent epimerase/dehydratase family protein n=1 Tax=Sphaerisporangium sp. TRM90804 TaxID=3031113 RepID=UPI0024498FA8|nr:NAD-dependent epimerase/dehydratase family protein [Sphaerisporangium sp. TRM90804]MDH2426778.1 NAD-dependent epimerase/dehydratase family protein [Sphaerisporangium sp. TRM90804]
MTHTVLVTGVSRHIGARVASVLAADPDIGRVIGVDTVPPPSLARGGAGVALGRTEFVRVDLRSPDIARVIAAADVDTVVHMSLVTAPSKNAGRSSMKEHNLIGTMQLLAACQRSATVRRVVVRSTTAVYGSSSHDPAVFTEEAEPVEVASSGYAKDATEVEAYVRGFARRRPDVSVSTLRFVNFMGPGVDSPLTRYFSQPVVPTVLGFDPRLQFVHEDDGVEVLRRMALEDHPGTFNVTGEGVLLLSQCVRRSGRPAVPVPSLTFRMLGDLARGLGRVDFSPEQLALMVYGRAVDAGRLAVELDWRPKFSTATAFDDFLHSRGMFAGTPLSVIDWMSTVLGGGVRR